LKDQYYILIQKLDQFIRKYYKNQLLRGGIYCVSLMLIFFLLVNAIEYLGHFDVLTRTILFYIYLFLNLFIFIRYIFIPGFKLFKIGKIISHEDAASIIGRHFSNVSDKLLNTLQLKKLFEADPQKTDLLSASIDQKIKTLKPIPFQSAIDLKINKKYLKYPVVPIVILFLILIISPGLITEPVNRLVNHNKEYLEPLPFKIIVQNEDLSVVQHDDFYLEVFIEGEEIPDFVLLRTGRNQIKLKKESAVKFQHRFINVQENTRFRKRLKQ